MYVVKIINGDIETPIHGNKEKLLSGKIVKSINAIDSFTFSMLPNNAGFNLINEFTTLVNVYNTRKNRYEFIGRVLYHESEMTEGGLISKRVICESLFGYLCDSQQKYVNTQNWTVQGLLQHLIDCHNSQVEDYKRFEIGTVTATDENNNLYLGIQRENTWDAIKSKLIDKIGGELRYRIEGEVIYIDYLENIGEKRSTPIALSLNMKSITREQDPTAFVTRLIPLGAKLSDETEERLDISSVNNGTIYVDDTTAIALYGVHVGYKEWDDVNSASLLKSKGEAWLIENNKVQIKYSITALDLSLLGLVIDDFDVGDYHPIKNALLGIDDTARINKKDINICEETKSTIEVGDNFKTLSDIQREQEAQFKSNVQLLQSAQNELKKEVSETKNQNAEVEGNLRQEIITQNTAVMNDCKQIILTALESYVLTENHDEFKKTVESQFQVMSEQISLNFKTTTERTEEVNGTLQTKFTEIYKYFDFSQDGLVIGSGDNAVTLTVDNDGIAFKRNGIQFGYWDGNYFYTGNIVVTADETARLGNFEYKSESDGSLSFSRVGG